MRAANLIPVVLLALLALPAAALADAAGGPPCHDYKEVARQLGSRYQESPVSIGMQANGNLLQVFASKASGSWTILSVSPDGMSCIIAAGESWETLPGRNLDPAA